MTKRKKLLMVAFHYPPSTEVGGFRAFNFSKDLYNLGWDPTVLTVNPRVYNKLDTSYKTPAQLEEKIYRSFSFNNVNDFSIFGKYPRFFEFPDRYLSWYVWGVKLGNEIIKANKPDVIWSTYPVSTAHLIARRLAKIHNIPWVAEFRDPHFNLIDKKAKANKLGTYIDKNTWQDANHLIFMCKQAEKLYQTTYENKNKPTSIVPNGFDETIFNLAKQHTAMVKSSIFTLSYFGGIYSSAPNSGRDVRPLFQALSILKKSNKITPQNFKLEFWGTEGIEQYRGLLNQLKIENLIQVNDRAPHNIAMKKMLEADALLLLQGKYYNYQIPAKLYEYIATGIPILALTEPDGATGTEVRDIPTARIASMDDVKGITASLEDIIKNPKRVINDSLLRFSRKSKAKLLVNILDKIVVKT